MGHHNRHYAGDPHASKGVWGRPTSTANFCEEDYAVTLYIAEFINTLTNLAYIWLALRYPKNPRRKSGWSVDHMSIAMIILGINSFVFHATMRHTTQYADELSMFILAGSLLQGVFAINQSPAITKTVACAILTTVSIMSTVYIRTGDILYHVKCFNSMTLIVGIRTMYLVFMGGRSGDEKKKLMKIFGKAVGFLAVGYTLWQIDLEKCIELRQLKQALGLPWAWLFELHGWWHVLTALGASQYVRLIRELEP